MIFTTVVVVVVEEEEEEHLVSDDELVLEGMKHIEVRHMSKLKHTG